MVNLLDISIQKSLSGRYKDNSENRRLHRVGQEYHHGSQQGEDNDNERQIKALQSKIEQMKKNKHIFIEQGGEIKYNRALKTLESKLNEIKGSSKSALEENKAKRKELLERADKLRAEKEKKKEIKAPEGVNQVQYENIVLDIMDRPSRHHLTIDGEDVIIDRSVDRSGGQVTPYYQIEESNKKYWDLDKMIEDYRKAKKIDEGIRKVEEKKNLETIKETNKKINEAIKNENKKESFTRVKFDDVPNSSKVNLKKYLSDKRRKAVDEQWGKITEITDSDLKKMEAGLVKKFNEGFESSSKSQRAEDLYHIMKVKGELQKRSKKN